MKFCEKMKTLPVHHVGIPTSDMNGSIAYYEQNQGMTLTYRKQIYYPMKIELAFLQKSDTVIELFSTPSMGKTPVEGGGIDHVAFLVDNALETLYEAKAAGLQVKSHTLNELPILNHGIRYFMVQGPDKELLEFMEICKC